MADRFYCPGPWRGSHAVLDGDEARHLARVRRVGVGGRVALFDGRGLAATAEVVTVDRDRVELVILKVEPPGGELSGCLTLATAVPKGERFDWLVEKATELGVARLVPIRAERSSVDPRPTKLDRLRRLAVEACKQSGRSRLMEIAEAVDWAEWLATGERDAASKLVAHPGGGPIGCGIDLAAGVVVAIGPEGGFTGAELEAAAAAGYRAVGLGPTILRVETAAVVTCGALVAASVIGDGTRRKEAAG